MRYNVSMNGRSLPVHEARVSACSFNKVWNGKQRPGEQTEIAWFVTFDFSGEAKLEIEILEQQITTLEIRPLDSDVAWRRSDNGLSIQLTTPRQFTVEVNGKHHALHVFANEPLRRERAENELYFGPGVHHAGAIMPESGQTVYLDEGAVVYGAIFVNRAKDVRITGRGILDASELRRGIDTTPGTPGGELADKLLSCGFSKRDVDYSGAFVAYECENLQVDGIIIRDSMFWSMIIRNNCRNVTIDNVKIIGQWRYNTDGINVCASHDVVVKNSFVRAFDDCVVIRNAYLEGENSDARNIAVENCVLWCDWGKSVEVWAGNLPYSICDIAFRKNFLIHLSALALDVTTWFGSDHTRIANIEFKDIFIDTDEEYESPRIQHDDKETYVSDKGFVPLLLRVDCDRLGESLGNQQAGSVADKKAFNLRYEHIVFENIRCRGRGKPLAVLIDSKRNPVEIDHVTLRGVDTDNVSIIGKIHNLSLEALDENH